MKRRGSLGPLWPSKGPDRGENILRFRRDGLSPYYRQKRDEAMVQDSPVGREVTKLRKDLDRLREDLRKCKTPTAECTRKPRTSKGTGPVLQSEKK